MVDTLGLGYITRERGVHMPKTKAPYPTEFKSEAVRLCCESGKPMSMIARDLGVLIESLRAVRTLNPDAAAAAS